MKRFCAFAVFLVASSFAFGMVVGSFDETRLTHPEENLLTGSSMTQFRTSFTSRGATITTTPELTPDYLATVDVFVTSHFTRTLPTQDEQNAMVAWVQGGGTLVVTAFCGCDGTQLAAIHLLLPFNIYLGSAGPQGLATIVNRHLVTAGLPDVQVGGNGEFIIKTGYYPLMNDGRGILMSAIVQGVTEVGKGRILLLGDVDMFMDNYQSTYPEDHQCSENVAAYVLDLSHALTGHVDLGSYKGSTDGLQMTLSLWNGNTPVASVPTVLDASGNYWQAVECGGTLDVVAKPSHWLSARTTAVPLIGDTLNIDWSVPSNGDVNGDNVVSLLDLSSVLKLFGSADPTADLDGNGSVGIGDLGIILKNYGQHGQ